MTKQTVKVRLSELDRAMMRAIALEDGVDTKLNDVTARAVEWAYMNRSVIAPFIVPRSNRQYVSLYINTDSQLRELVDCWDCTLLEALYSALRHYMNYRDIKAGDRRGVA